MELLLFFLFFFFYVSFSSSHLIIPLSHSHSLSPFNSTPHLLKSTAARSSSRFHHHRHRHHRRVSLPLSPGADYTLSFSLGAQTISLYLDTGSDVVWLPCHPFDCILCEGEYSPSTVPHPSPFNLSSSAAAPVPCKSPACSAAHSSLPSSDLCAIASCPLEDIEISDCASSPCPSFYYAYGDGSFVGNLYKHNLSLPNLNLDNFTFACAHSALAEPIGVAGFGRGPLSFPTQLAPEMGRYFSYCLNAHAFDSTRALQPSPLILGRRRPRLGQEDKDELEERGGVDYTYTPMLRNPRHAYFYCVGLEAVSIGATRIPAPASLRRVDRRGNGGMVVDSGTTFTMLPREFYLAVAAEFRRRVGATRRRAGGVEARTGLSPCYYAAAAGGSFDDVAGMTWHFLGNNSAVAMPRRNYFHEFFDGEAKRKVGCLMLMDGGDEKERGGGPAGLLGNYQQQGFEVVYDLEEKRLGFAKRECSSLWDDLD